jgi:hypothetical protein
MSEETKTTNSVSNDPLCTRFEGLREGHGLGHKNLRHRNGVLATVPDALHNDSDSVREVLQEKPIHRHWVDLSLQGYTPTEIAKMTGHSMQWVSQVLKQPFARQYFINQSKKTVNEEIKALLEQEAIPSLKMLKNVRDNAPKASDRVAASRELLDRFLGKSTQPISNNVKPPSEMSDDELRAEVQREITATQPN